MSTDLPGGGEEAEGEVFAALLGGVEESDRLKRLQDDPGFQRREIGLTSGDAVIDRSLYGLGVLQRSRMAVESVPFDIDVDIPVLFPAGDSSDERRRNRPSVPIRRERECDRIGVVLVGALITSPLDRAGSFEFPDVITGGPLRDVGIVDERTDSHGSGLEDQAVDGVRAGVSGRSATVRRCCKAFDHLEMAVWRVVLTAPLADVPVNGVTGIDASGLNESTPPPTTRSGQISRYSNETSAVDVV